MSVSVSGGTTVVNQNNSNPISSGLVWVPVRNGQVDNNWTSGSPDAYYNFPQMCGYALYTASEWNSVKPKSDLAAGEAPDPLLFLPAAGVRFNDGALYYSGAGGLYWSSTVYGDNSQGLCFYGASVDADADDNRAGGWSVRCVAE